MAFQNLSSDTNEVYFSDGLADDVIVELSCDRSLPPGQSTRAASRLADKPSIAVLAFVNMTGDPDQGYFSDGVADDIITELSRSRPLLAAARNSSFTYKNRAVDVKQVARELGVRYVLEGSVRRSGGRVQISAQLIDAVTGYHIWAERYDCGGTELLAVQDEATAAVTEAIHSAVADAEFRRVLRKMPDSLGAWEAYQLGLWHLAKFKAADNERAIELFRRVITQDDTFVTAYISLAAAYCESGQAFAVRPLDEAAALAGNWARKAAELILGTPRCRLPWELSRIFPVVGMRPGNTRRWHCHLAHI